MLALYLINRVKCESLVLAFCSEERHSLNFKALLDSLYSATAVKAYVCCNCLRAEAMDSEHCTAYLINGRVPSIRLILLHQTAHKGLPPLRFTV